MNQIAKTRESAKETVLKLLHLLKDSGGLSIDARVVEQDETVPGNGTSSPPEIAVHISGPDAPLFLHNQAELLKAVHHVAAAALHREQLEFDRLWFDIDNVPADRMAELQLLAAAAIDRVRETSQEFAFAPMPGCERHMLHRALEGSGLNSESIGGGPERRVVLHPSGPPQGPEGACDAVSPSVDSRPEAARRAPAAP